MKKLLEAIYTHYGTSGLASELDGGLHYGRAPQGETFPYGVYTFPTIIPDGDETFTSSLEGVFIQFNFHDENSSAVDLIEIVDECLSTFDGQAITVTDTADAVFRRNNVILPFRSTANDREVWEAVVEFEITYQRYAIHHT
jgi:hypothetical protein